MYGTSTFFSEIRAARDSLVLDRGHHLYFDLSAHFASGVGLLSHARLTQYVQKEHKISDRVIGVDLHFDQIRIRCIAVYLPHAVIPSKHWIA